jgi:hypothetical protein
MPTSSDKVAACVILRQRLAPPTLLVVTVALLALALHRAGPLPLAVTLTALAALPLPVMLAVVLGNGCEDAAKWMHLVFTLVLSFWLLSALAAATALAARLRSAAAARKETPGRPRFP